MTLNTLDDNTVFWSPFYTALENALAGDGIISGCAISKGTGDWDIDVTSGTIIESNTEASISSGTVTITDSSALTSGQSRITLIHADTGDALASTDGSAAANPDAPDLPANEVLLGFVVVENGDSTVADSDIIDIPALLGNDNARYQDGGSHEIDVADFAGGDGTDGQVPVTDGSAVTWSDLIPQFSHTFVADNSAISTTGTSWVRAAGFVPAPSVNWAGFDSGEFSVELSAGSNTAEARARDTTNSATIANVSTTSTSRTRVADTSISFPNGTADVRCEFRNDTGGQTTNIWGAVLTATE